MAPTSVRRRVGYQTKRKPIRGKKEKRQQGVDKVEIGLQIAYILARAPEAMHLGDIAKQANLPPSKAHRFLVSLCRSEIIEQDPVDGRYDLGGGAIQLGLAAQNRLDEFRLGERALRELHDKTKRNVGIITWADRGPTIVRRIDSLQPVILTSRIGSSVSVLNSAAGRVFAALLPASVVKPAIDSELRANIRPRVSGKEISMEDFEKLLDRIRAEQFAEVHGAYFTGFDAISAPVFDASGTVAMTLGAMGPNGTFSPENGGPECRSALTSIAAQLSARLGAKNP